MTDILTPAARKIAYRVYSLVALVLGAIQVGIAATPNTAQPAWLTTSFAVLAFVGTAFGLVAQANVKDEPGDV